MRHLLSDGGGFERRLPIATDARDGVNRLTAFIAENGRRKSFLLRSLAEPGLGGGEAVINDIGLGSLSPRFECLA